MYNFYFISWPPIYVLTSRSKILPSKLEMITFLIRCCFDVIFYYFNTKSFWKMPNLKQLFERQCVITLPMTFNSAWLWKFKNWSLRIWQKLWKWKWQGLHISISFRMNQTIQGFLNWKSHLKRLKMCLRSEKRSKSFGRKNRECFPRNLCKYVVCTI